MSNNFKTAAKIILILVATIGLSYLLAPVGGSIHNSFWESHGCDFWGPCDDGSYVEGFIYFYILLITLLLFSFFKKNTAWIFWIFFTILPWGLIIYLIASEGLKFRQPENIGRLAIMIIATILGHLLAWGYRKLYPVHTDIIPAPDSSLARSSKIPSPKLKK